ncbi:radical SAM protein [Vibrio metschnikovii]|nr:radical SAM protein [Vibrio metschnikovii]EKO3689950.1 radical SAM protein [Vibrio metschnikovii]EKO3694174.1 radical SAM protein [Vibrio metschnikovii]EKO3890466.1 radical SAM protein [Vibrio metschnikovii]
MKEINFDIESTIEFPTPITEYKHSCKHVLIATHIPNWVSLNDSEYHLYKEMQEGKTILESLQSLHLEFGFSEDKCTNIITRFLSKIEDSKFYLSNDGEDEESIRSFQKSIHLEITSDCNIRCKHCYMSAGKLNAKHLSLNEIIDFFNENELERINKDIIISGGEPMIHPDFKEIVQYLKRLDFKICLFTNGLLIDSDCIGYLSENIDSVQISMEGITKDSYEKIRGKNTYEKLINSINLIKSNSIYLILAITVLDDTINDIDENLEEFLKQLSYDNIEVRINDEIEKKGNALSLSDNNFNNIVFNKSKVKSIIDKVENQGFYFSPSNSKCKRFTNCGIGASIVISSTGDIYPCNDYEQPSEFNILNSTLTDVIEKYDSINEDTSTKNILKCNSCEIKYLCGGGCRTKNLRERGSMNAISCNKTKIISDIAISMI